MSNHLLRRRVARRGRHLALATTAILLASLAALLGPTASAHTATITTQHTLRLGSGVLTGQLSAPITACLAGRTVTLYRAGATGATAVSTTVTGSGGAWTRSATGLQGGSYFAVAASKVVTSSGHRHTCTSARSNTVNVPVDADRDGFTTTNDCNDADSTVNPGAAEVRNGVDDDCDGAVDEGYGPPPTTCWVPSSETVTAETTWSQVTQTQPCEWVLYTWTVLPGAVYMGSSDWLIEYHPAAGAPAAFQYDDQAWAFFAAHPNSIYTGS